MKKQKNPIKNKSKPIVKQVIKDLNDRMKSGILTYGTPLQTWNSRNSVQDLYEEELDKIQYLKQWLLERQEMIECIEYSASVYQNEKAKILLSKIKGHSK